MFPVELISDNHMAVYEMNASQELVELHRQIGACTRCRLHATRTNAVPGEGPPDARLMFVGEAPGAAEDESGRPFVGRSGELLTKLLNEIGISRHGVFITSVLKSRPPGNRVPNQDEIDACRPYLERQIDIINPKIVVLLGSTAVASVIGPWKISEAHGRFHEADSRTFFITYHPSAALRFPSTLQAMREDIQLLKKELD